MARVNFPFFSNISDFWLLILKYHLIYYVHEKFWNVCKNWSLFRAFSYLLFFTDNSNYNSLHFNQKLLLKHFSETRTPYEYKANVKNLKINDRSEICSKSVMEFFIPKYSNFDFFFNSILRILFNYVKL